ncbi:MAG: glucosamine-6-phosphate isomerase [Candidatus Sumerlaeota bacterium]|nr:glucosamine-6-phosphate isomerase [Candidatus Sumerlaeota bacterium]
MNRAQEIRELLSLSAREMVERAQGKLIVLSDLDAVHRHCAESIFDEIDQNNQAGRPTRLILPVGPVGQYPILLELINRRRLSLKTCHFFFMDEYCDEDGRAIGPDHPLSFRGQMMRDLFNRIDPALNIPAEQLIFPNEKNLSTLAASIKSVGGIDTCYGGIGIHGHVAFNEPEPGVRDSGPRVVNLNDFTITINAIRADVGGNLEGFPRQAVTLGMKQILGARRIRLYCRNGGPYDWANTVLRLAVFSEPGDDYPVTLIRGKDFVVITDEATAATPRYIL